MRKLFTLIMLFMLGLTQPCAAQTEATVIQKIAASAHAAGQFDGVVLVARHGKVIAQAAAGQANRARGLPNTPDTPYRICSITKQFTALLIMQQVQAGRLRLDGTITNYLPDFRRDTGSKITLRNLLTHTSGLKQLDDVLPMQNGFPGFYRQTGPQFVSAAHVVKTLLQGDLLSTPGAKFNYNNSDYIVLQAILEKVTGKPFARLLKDNITRPLGMTHTGLIAQDSYSPRQAVGYVVNKGVYGPEPFIHIATFGASGAMYSTAGDLLRWDTALDRNTLLSKASREIMFTADKSLGYVALGSWVYRGAFKGSDKKPLLIEHQGEIGGFRTLNLRAPEEGISIIVLCNSDTVDLSATYMQTGLAYAILQALYAPGT